MGHKPSAVQIPHPLRASEAMAESTSSPLEPVLVVVASIGIVGVAFSALVLTTRRFSPHSGPAFYVPIDQAS